MVRLYAVKLLLYRTHHLQTARRQSLVTSTTTFNGKRASRISHSGFMGADHAQAGTVHAQRNQLLQLNIWTQTKPLHSFTYGNRPNSDIPPTFWQQFSKSKKFRSKYCYFSVTLSHFTFTPHSADILVDIQPATVERLKCQCSLQSLIIMDQDDVLHAIYMFHNFHLIGFWF